MKMQEYVKPEIKTVTYDVDSGFLLSESFTMEGIPGYSGSLGAKDDGSGESDE
jgi:hypothetical protein